MKLVSIEPTPNPNSMKLNLGESLPKGVSRTYTSEDKNDCPDYIERLLGVPGVKSLFHLADFVAVQRHPRVDWQGILAGARRAFGEETEDGSGDGAEATSEAVDAFGEVQVEVQMFREIPMLVKVSAGTDMHREALPASFATAMERAAASSPNMLAERRWVERGKRYGDLVQVAHEVVEEIAAAYDDERLDELVRRAFIERTESEEDHTAATRVTELPDDADWRVRYAALEKIGPRLDGMAVFLQALHDPKSSIRRLAAVYLGLVGDPTAVLPLCAALEDPTVSVRRTAGDSLSDLGDSRAIVPMTVALRDPNKLVRWRAARFLFETGDESALPALRESAHDSEFEVRLQIRLAIERIEGGHEGQGPVWRQMTGE